MVQHNRRIGSKKEPVQAFEFAWKTGVGMPDSPVWHITLSLGETVLTCGDWSESVQRDKVSNYVILIFRVNIT